MSYEEFKNKWLGKPIDYDGKYLAQCVDVYRMYVKEVLGCPQSPPVVGAKDIWNTYLPEFFNRIENSTDNKPEQGDIVIWGMDPYGHIAICDHATLTTLTCFEQNWKELDGSGVTELRLHGNYNNVLGWLRCKIKPVNDSDPIMTAEETKILEFVREKKITEGQIRQGYGYITDNIQERVEDLEKLAYDRGEQVKNLMEKLANEHKSAVGWQNALKIANAEIKDLRAKLLSDNLTPWQHIKLGINLLVQKQK